MSFRITRAQGIAMAGLLAVAVIDFMIPLGVATGILYLFIYFFLIKQPVKSIVAFTVASIALALIKLMVYQTSDTSWMAFINRGLTIFAIILTSLIVIQHRLLYEKRRKEREKYVRLLQETNDKLLTYKQAIDTHLLFTITDTNGLILFANQKFCEISKFTKEELCGNSHRLIKSGEHSAEFYKELWTTIRTGKPWRGEVKNKAKDGTMFWCDTVILPIRKNDNEVVEFFVLRALISQRKELEEKLKENVNTYEKILFDISHKLRAPISTCMGLTYLLEKDPIASELTRLAIEQRKACTTKLDCFSKDLSDFIYKHAGGKFVNEDEPL